MLPIMRPMKESTMSSEEMSIRTPRALNRENLIGQVVLKGHDQAIVHINLDGHEEVFPHAENRDMFHDGPSVIFGC